MSDLEQRICNQGDMILERERKLVQARRENERLYQQRDTLLAVCKAQQATLRKILRDYRTTSEMWFEIDTKETNRILDQSRAAIAQAEGEGAE